MNLYRTKIIARRVVLNYTCVVITYSLARIPIGVLVLAFSRGQHPETLAWAMRYPDRVIYLPFNLLLDALQGLEGTALFTCLVIGYYSTAVLLLLGIGIVAIFKGLRRFFEIMGG